jgi:putative nucleotidyltransferase with HDIG domain
MKRLGIDTQPDLSPAVQEVLEAYAASAPVKPSRRELCFEAMNVVAFIGAAGLLAALLPSERTVEWPLVAAIVAALAVSKQVKFEVGTGYGLATQLVFVPALLLLPPGWVPFTVLAGMVLGSVPYVLRDGVHVARLVQVPGDCWYAVAPALVIGLAAPGEPTLGQWPVYVAALAAQLACDLGASTFQDWAGQGVRPRLQLALMGWVSLVDLLLAPIGLAAALASVHAPYAFLLVVPLVALLGIFARERSARIENAVELGRAYRGTTLLLSDVLEADDAYTGRHSHGVVALAVTVAKELGLSATERRNVEFGALLHDIGKIAISNEIINKPGPLDPEEWLVIKTHTVEGQRMLDRVGGVMGEIGQIVRSSHERWDGSGYPDGLTGAAIPRESRVVACCDAYNAMTTDRSYRRAMTVGEALVELRLNEGTQFDPQVVAALIAVLERDGVGSGAAVAA